MKEVGYLDISDTKRLVLTISDFRGTEKVDLRENYLNKEGSYNPTRRGVNFDIEWLPDFVKLINKLNEI